MNDGMRWVAMAAVTASVLVPLAGGCRKKDSTSPPAATATQTEAAEPLKFHSLQEAAKNGDLEDVQRHVQRGAAVNATDERGSTALQYAAGQGSIEIVQYLVSQKAGLELRDSRGMTALDQAVAAAG